MINLITNKDIKEIGNKSSLSIEDLQIVQLKGLLESKIQERCKNILEALGVELERKYSKKVVEFVQFDNGDTSAGKLKPYQRMALFKRKKAEGSKKGFPDTGIFIGSPCGQYSKVILTEFKRIGSLSQIDISPEQEYYHNWLNLIGFKAYITNNPIFFKNVICKEVTNFLENKI